MTPLGNFLQGLRAKSKVWLLAFFALLAALVGLNLFIHPHHPHVAAEVYAGFWALFSLVAAIGMVFLMKGVVSEVLAVDEDYYVSESGDGEGK